MIVALSIRVSETAISPKTSEPQSVLEYPQLEEKMEFTQPTYLPQIPASRVRLKKALLDQ